ncbi:MAG: leucine-rich repeat domain-containing protein [Clostridia bacterium]|nr:leucine-rich repeat domain-containing protein [Clostridia bacterium]
MQNIFEMNSLESKLKYIQISAPAVFERVQSEIEEGAALKNSLIVTQAIFEAFDLSGNEAIITTHFNDTLGIFKYLTKQTSAYIHGKYKVIESNCFSHCPSLKTIIFEEGVEQINSGVLCENQRITSIAFPKSLKSIGNDAFRNCKNLKEVIFNNSKTWISPDAFEGTMWLEQQTEEFVVVNDQLLKYNGNSETVIIPEGILHIGDQVFENNQIIKTLILPTSLKSIWTYSFADCSNLSKVVFNNNLHIIGISAFEGCINLNEVYLPKHLKELGAIAFDRNTIIHFYDTDKNLTRHIKKNYPNCISMD